MDILRKGTIKRIHVSQPKIRNAEPDPIIVRTSQGPIYACEVEILGASKMVYCPDKPLSNGAKVWIETKAEVVIVK